ncbi:MAG: DUF3347 domain-containing protein, partial [Candidatus Saccharimonadales bacterium]
KNQDKTDMKKIAALSVMLIIAFSVSFANAQNNINNITNAYLGVKNALAAGKATDAQAEAKGLFAALSGPENGLSPGQQKIFNSYADKLKFDSRHISASTDIEHQREHFENLSKNLYEVLKAVSANSATIYMQYCPMKKACWLSEISAIKNPYYNDRMMTTCGRTKATLEAVK